MEIVIWGKDNKNNEKRSNSWGFNTDNSDNNYFSY